LSVGFGEVGVDLESASCLFVRGREEIGFEDLAGGFAGTLGGFGAGLATIFEEGFTVIFASGFTAVFGGGLAAGLEIFGVSGVGSLGGSELVGCSEFEVEGLGAGFDTGFAGALGDGFGVD